VTDERKGEQGFFEEEPAEPPPPPKRRSALLARNPAIAVLALAVASWLLFDLWPEVSYFFSSTEPIDLGGPGAYQLERARENRLVQVRGELEKAVAATEARTGGARTIGILAGTNLVVDRPGRGGPPLFEGRLLPSAARDEYAAAVKIMREKGAMPGDRWLVLRDGDRPRHRWLPVLGAALLVALVVLNLGGLFRALIR